MEQSKKLLSELYACQKHLRAVKGFFKSLSNKYIEVYKFSNKECEKILKQPNVLDIFNTILATTYDINNKFNLHIIKCSEYFRELHSKLKSQGIELKKVIYELENKFKNLNSDWMKKRNLPETNNLQEEESNFYQDLNFELLKEIYYFSKEILMKCNDFANKISGLNLKEMDKLSNEIENKITIVLDAKKLLNRGKRTYENITDFLKSNLDELKKKEDNQELNDNDYKFILNDIKKEEIKFESTFKREINSIIGTKIMTNASEDLDIEIEKDKFSEKVLKVLHSGSNLESLESGNKHPSILSLNELSNKLITKNSLLSYNNNLSPSKTGVSGIFIRTTSSELGLEQLKSFRPLANNSTITSEGFSIRFSEIKSIANDNQVRDFKEKRPKNDTHKLKNFFKSKFKVPTGENSITFNGSQCQNVSKLLEKYCK